MKSIKLIPMVIVLVLYACTNETDELNTINFQQKTYLNTLGNYAGNINNPYDDVGASYSNALSLYKAAGYKPKNYEDLLLLVQSLSGDASPVAGDSSTKQLLASCMNTPDVALGQILQNPLLSQNAVTILSDFYSSYDHWVGKPFGEAYSAITAIETGILKSPDLSVEEQRIILAVTSLTRYSLYHSCCEDTDWEKSVGNIVAALAGAIESNNIAVQYPLITSIAALEKIQL